MIEHKKEVELSSRDLGAANLLGWVRDQLKSQETPFRTFRLARLTGSTQPSHSRSHECSVLMVSACGASNMHQYACSSHECSAPACSSTGTNRAAAAVLCVLGNYCPDATTPSPTAPGCSWLGLLQSLPSPTPSRRRPPREIFLSGGCGRLQAV